VCVPSSKREREYERRRYEKWQERQQVRRAQRRRTQVIAGSVVGVLVVVGGVAAAIGLSRGDDAGASPSPSSSTSTATDASTASTEARTGNGGVLPDVSLAEDRTWTGTITTDQGDIGIELEGDVAPQAVANFVTLAQEGYFDDTACHRLVTSGIYVLQCGDPTATGTGGPGYSWGPIENAPSDDVYPAGTIAMARQGGDGESMGSQFFLVYEDSTIPSDTAGGYTVFGRITSGLDVVQAIADAGVSGGASDGAPLTPVTIEGVETQ
jgi:peptidyl-prolyl cis-trans isomerase B (cyclophilin B)